jgi:hypothetical protein
MSLLTRTVPLVDDAGKDVEKADWQSAQYNVFAPSKPAHLADLPIMAADRGVHEILAPRLPPNIHLAALKIPKAPESVLPRGSRRRAKSHSLPRRAPKPRGTRMVGVESWMRSEPHLGFLGEVDRPQQIHWPGENNDKEDESQYEPRIVDHMVHAVSTHYLQPNGRQSPDITTAEQTNWVSSPVVASLPTVCEENLVKIGRRKRRIQKNAIQASQLSIK